MPRGGARLGSGRKKGVPNKKTVEALANNSGEPPPLPEKPVLPLEYMLRVLNDPKSSKDDKIKMASLAAPYCHVKAGEKGKKDDQAEKAKKAASGRFASAPGPKVVSIRNDP